MKPFKFLSGRLTGLDVASWDFHQDYEYPFPDRYHVEVEWHDSFISFLSKFNADDTVLVDEIKMPWGPNDYISLNHHTFDTWLDEFTSWDGRVRVTWLNFDVI